MNKLIEKQRHIIDFTLSSLWRRKGRNLALMLVYTVVVFSLGSVMFFTQALKNEAALILSGTPEIVVQKMVAGRHELIPVTYAQKIEKIRGVKAVKPRLWGYYFDRITRANYTFMVPEDMSLINNEIIIGSGIARIRVVGRGNALLLRTYDGKPFSYLIKGVLSPDSELLSADLILISEAGFHRLFGISPKNATDFTVTVLNKKEIPTIAAKIVDLLPDTRAITRDEILRTYDAVFDWRGGIIIAILAGAVLAFLIFAWDKAAGLSAEEKREIGILKAIGWETGDVLHMKFWEGMIISLSSFLAGVILAYLHIFTTSASLFAPVLKGWATLYPNFSLTPFISVYQVAILFCFTVIPYTVATIIPSWKAATIDPDLIMRT
ncbi:MAG: FtsX-like permease family protein [Desulfobaccales bacterium]